jgi:hypothetical protein
MRAGFGLGVFGKFATEIRISLCEMRQLFTIFDFWCSIGVIDKE